MFFQLFIATCNNYYHESSIMTGLKNHKIFYCGFVQTGLYIGARLPIYIAFLIVVLWYLRAVIRDCLWSCRLGFQEAVSEVCTCVYMMCAYA